MENFTFNDRLDNQRVQLIIDQYAKQSDSIIVLLFMDFQNHNSLF